MTSAFAAAMNTTTTWNGAKSLSPKEADGTGNHSGRMNLFYKGVRDLPVPALYAYLREASAENKLDTLILSYYIRDCRGGKGERALGRRALIWYALQFPGRMQKTIHLLPEYGRWDDLLFFFPGVLKLDATTVENYCVSDMTPTRIQNIKSLQNTALELFVQQLRDDLKNMKDGTSNISLCAKWAPTENDSMDREHHLVKTICKKMNTTAKTYRKEFITPLRAYIKVVETLMCSDNWDQINFNTVPSCAMLRLKSSFEKHVPEQYAEWKNKLTTGESTVKGKQLFPYEIIRELRTRPGHNIVTEKQWQEIAKTIDTNGKLQSVLCVCDVSGSMDSWGFNRKKAPPVSFTPKDVAMSLSLIISEVVQGSFANHIIAFDETPSFLVTNQSTLYERLNCLSRAPWGMSTNLMKVFTLILEKAKAFRLPQKDMPRKVIIFSDMQFDAACDNSTTNFECIDKKYQDSGYKRPQLVFWNITGSTTDIPVTTNQVDTALISGFSPSIVKAVLEDKSFTPVSIMEDVVNSIRYQPIRDILSVD